MLFGNGGIILQALNTPGPPFIPTAAENGLKIAANGRIVLGNDSKLPGAADFLSNRFINLNTKTLTISNGNVPTGTIIANQRGLTVNTDYEYPAITPNAGMIVGNFFGVSSVAPSATFQSTINGTPITATVTHAAGNFGLIVQRATASAGAPNFAFYKTRNADPTIATAPIAADQLGRLHWFAPGTSGNIAIAGFIQMACVSVGATFVSAAYNFFTTNAAGTSGNRLTIMPEGEVAFGDNINGIAGIRVFVNGMCRTPGTTGATFNWNLGTTAPAPVVAAPVFADYYGTGGTRALSEPANWVLVNIAGTDFKIPAYAV